MITKALLKKRAAGWLHSLKVRANPLTKRKKRMQQVGKIILQSGAIKYFF
jgi:hypothetical protein